MRAALVGSPSKTAAKTLIRMMILIPTLMMIIVTICTGNVLLNKLFNGCLRNLFSR